MRGRRSATLALAAMVALAGASAAAPARSAKPDVLARRQAAFTPGQGLPNGSATDLGFSPARLETLNAAMAGTVADGEVAGMITLLARHGQVVNLQTYGEAAPGVPMTPDTLFRIYSMTKPVTGVAMMILFEEGKWGLDDPVTKFIPEFKNLKVFQRLDANGAPSLVEARRPPTMRELMSHTAGLGYGLSTSTYVDKEFIDRHVLDAPNRREMIDRMAAIPLLFQPGESWSYSAATDVQGYIVERLSGMTLGEFMRRRIFAPLKMNDTFFTVPTAKASRLGALYRYNRRTGKLQPATEVFGAPVPDVTKAPPMEEGGGGLVSTAADYARFALMLANGGELAGARILSPSTVKLMRTNVIPRRVLLNRGSRTGLAARFNEAVGFGLDLMVDMDPRLAGSPEGKDTVSWEGAGGTWFWVDPTNDVVFVGMVQRFGTPPQTLDLQAASRALVYQALVDPRK